MLANSATPNVPCVIAKAKCGPNSLSFANASPIIEITTNVPRIVVLFIFFHRWYNSITKNPSRGSRFRLLVQAIYEMRDCFYDCCKC